MRLEAGLEQGGQVVGLRFGPDFVEPFPHRPHHMGRVVPQVQLQVSLQAGAGEVGRPGHHPVRLVPDQEGLPMQETVLQPPHFHLPRPKPFNQPFGAAVGLHGEAEHVPLIGEQALVFVEGPLQAFAGRPLRVR